MDKPRKNIPFVSYFLRTWPLLLLVLATNVLTRWDHAVTWIPNGTDEWGHTVWQGLTIHEVTGAVLDLVALGCTVLWVAGLLIHLFNTLTIERDIRLGRTQKDWDAITPSERVRYTYLNRAAILVVLGLIAAALAK